MMKELQVRFLLRLFFFSGVIFGIHLLVLNYFNKALFDAMLVEAYVANVLLALVIYFFLYRFRIRFKNQLGFLFLIGSLLKFVIFFMLFYNEYQEDSLITPQEFSAFFVPYTLTLVVEVFSLSKWMNKLES